jgi:hypothetical protein
MRSLIGGTLFYMCHGCRGCIDEKVKAMGNKAERSRWLQTFTIGELSAYMA